MEFRRTSIDHGAWSYGMQFRSGECTDDLEIYGDVTGWRATVTDDEEVTTGFRSDCGAVVDDSVSSVHEVGTEDVMGSVMGGVMSQSDSGGPEHVAVTTEAPPSTRDVRFAHSEPVPASTDANVIAQQAFAHFELIASNPRSLDPPAGSGWVTWAVSASASMSEQEILCPFCESSVVPRLHSRALCLAARNIRLGRDPSGVGANRYDSVYFVVHGAPLTGVLAFLPPYTEPHESFEVDAEFDADMEDNDSS